MTIDQVFHDPERTGTSMVNLGVAVLDRRHAALHERDIDTGEISEADKGVRLCSVKDPDDNTITFIGSFREQY